MRSMAFVIVIGAMVGSTASSGLAQAPGAGEKPVFVRAPDALERVTWRTRTLVGDDRLTTWKFAVPATGVASTTFLEAVVRADAAVVNFIEGASAQRVSPQLAKNLDSNLTPGEIADLRARMGTVRMVSYRVATFATDSDARRKLFAFSKAMDVDTLVVPADSDLTALDALADEYGINVAVLTDRSGAAHLVKVLEGRSKRLGLAGDARLWGQDATSARDALTLVRSRLSYVSLAGAANRPEFFHELNRLNIRPLIMTLDTSGVVKAPGELFRAIDLFEAAVQPAYGDYFTEFSRAVPIRRDLVRPARGETLTDAVIKQRSAEVLQKIRAAIPTKPYAPPQKPRKLLVVESLHGMSHDTIPHANVMIEEMGRITGAWTTELNNDLNNLKYPKIAAYDAVFLNSIVGEFAAEPEVRDGLARFVREGGGLGGVHGTPWASRNWDEFAEMIGSQSAPHRIEQGVMKVQDAASPIMKPFGGKDLSFREEYYRFEHEGRGRLRWDKVRVLMTVALDDPTIEPRLWNGYKRPDNVYPVTWVRSYGKGRVFYSSLGHMEDTFTTPALVGHFFAGVQFMLGDLDVNTTPNAGGMKN